MNPKLRAVTALMALLLLLSGCEEKRARAQTAPLSKQEELTAKVEEGEEKKSPPASPDENPLLAKTKPLTKSIDDRLTAIRTKLKEFSQQFAKRKRGDLQQSFDTFKTLIVQARADTDSFLRHGKDLHVELQSFEKSLRYVSDIYQDRLLSLSNEWHKELIRSLLSQIEELATDTPRRLKETGRFLADLEEFRRDFAQSEMVLVSSKELDDILILGAPRARTLSANIDVFENQINAFIATIEDYVDRLLQSPLTPEQKGKEYRKKEASLKDPIEEAHANTVKELVKCFNNSSLKTSPPIIQVSYVDSEPTKKTQVASTRWQGQIWQRSRATEAVVTLVIDGLKVTGTATFSDALTAKRQLTLSGTIDNNSLSLQTFYHQELWSLWKCSLDLQKGTLIGNHMPRSKQLLPIDGKLEFYLSR